MMDDYTFGPEEARAIYAATVGADYNFRKSGSGQRVTQRYIDLMRQGEWRWHDAAPIRLSSDRRLCSDGLHRLLACAITGIPLRSFVIVGDEYAAGVHTDRGQWRTTAQVLASKGLTQVAHRAALSTSHLARLIADAYGISVGHAAATRVHPEAVIEHAEKHADLVHWCVNRVRPASQRGFNSTGYGVFLFECSTIDAEMTELFHQTFTGSTDNENDPILRLRLYQWRRFEPTGRRMSLSQTLDSFVKCWNLSLEGEQVKLWKPPLYETVRFPDGYKNPMRGCP
jgi:hypothetical protein